VPDSFADAHPGDAARRLWAAAAHPIDTIRAAETLIGLTPAAARMVSIGSSR
jgi:hypothetical protein